MTNQIPLQLYQEQPGDQKANEKNGACCSPWLWVRLPGGESIDRDGALSNGHRLRQRQRPIALRLPTTAVAESSPGTTSSARRPRLTSAAGPAVSGSLCRGRTSGGAAEIAAAVPGSAAAALSVGGPSTPRSPVTGAAPSPWGDRYTAVGAAPSSGRGPVVGRGGKRGGAAGLWGPGSSSEGTAALGRLPGEVETIGLRPLEEMFLRNRQLLAPA
ncbi:uncharacterized protein LOC121233765 [Aquila chrysaetos chrysaetos]|uniref:uncharacterized protein LOC121233765 n=1 Tax=Aquila chrysaetos chrysaetos TaxID=223781 RepID=UPI001B7D2B61|nr:uncharacterized protein LOC121233765 [Aquila chrysaetos chrysaetos]